MPLNLSVCVCVKMLAFSQDGFPGDVDFHLHSAKHSLFLFLSGFFQHVYSLFRTFFTFPFSQTSPHSHTFTQTCLETFLSFAISFCSNSSSLNPPQVNNVDFANIIREEAVLFLLDLPKGEEVTILAQKKKDGEDMSALKL